MKRVLLDTNIYGEIISKRDEELVKAALNAPNKEFVFYGSEVVRKELRATPRGNMLPEKISGNKKARIALLSLYDLVVSSHFIKIDKKIEQTAQDYYKVHREISGKSNEKILNDFRIVASAALWGLDVVYSEDNNTMRSPQAMKAYAIVSSLKGIKVPEFKSYAEFIKELKRLLF